MPLELISNVIGKALLEFHQERTAETGATMTFPVPSKGISDQHIFCMQSMYQTVKEQLAGNIYMLW